MQKGAVALICNHVTGLYCYSIFCFLQRLTQSYLSLWLHYREREKTGNRSCFSGSEARLNVPGRGQNSREITAPCHLPTALPAALPTEPPSAGLCGSWPVVCWAAGRWGQGWEHEPGMTAFWGEGGRAQDNALSLVAHPPKAFDVGRGPLRLACCVNSGERRKSWRQIQNPSCIIRGAADESCSLSRSQLIDLQHGEIVNTTLRNFWEDVTSKRGCTRNFER